MFYLLNIQNQRLTAFTQLQFVHIKSIVPVVLFVSIFMCLEIFKINLFIKLAFTI